MKGIHRFFVVASLVIFTIPFAAHAQTLPVVQCDTPAQKVQCQADLLQAEAEAKAAQLQLNQAQEQSASLQQAINVLNAKIKVAQANIKAKNLLIQTLGNDISTKQSHINTLDSRIEKGKQTLAQLLRKTNEVDGYSLPEVILSQSNLTEFFKDLDTFQEVQDGLKSTFELLRSDKTETESAKKALDTRRNTEIDARYVIQKEQNNIKSDEEQKKNLLAVSKGSEKAYSSLLAQKQAKAAQIRSALFSLRDAAAIPFGQALLYAQKASALTGVRPAFILAILTQESALGKNVGSCYLTNAQTGSGINMKTGSFVSNVMKPGRDVEPFVTILQKLGGDPYKQVVSCPQSVGWGGAMGPSQFIASTWMLFKDRIAAAVGISGMPDPWNPAHAFIATSIYVGDLGAGARTYSAERNAACRYYSGSSCSKSSLIASYGNQVVARADTIQRTMIDPLQGF